MKTREIKEYFRAGIDNRKLEHIIVAQNEHLMHLEKGLRELAFLFNNLTELTKEMHNLAGQSVDATLMIKKKFPGVFVDSEQATQPIADTPMDKD